MERCMKVTIGVVVTEDEVKDYIRRHGGNTDEINDDSWWCEYLENKYGIGYGAEASFC
jgi:hypothetical protein